MVAWIARPLGAAVWFALAGVALAADAAPTPWYAEPVGLTLHPVRPQPMLAWHRAVATAMAGPDASTLFRDVSNKLDVYWTLEAADLDPIPLDDATRDLAFDRSLQGLTLGFSRLVQDTLDNNEVLETADRVVATGLRPAVIVDRGDEGTRVRLDRRPWSASGSLASVSDPSHLPREGPPTPSLRTGGGLRLVEDPDLGDTPLTDLAPAAQAWLGLDNLGVDALLVDATWVRPWARPEHPRIWWDFALRQALTTRLALRASTSSADDNPLPDRARLGFSWQIPEHQDWRVYLDGVRYFPDPADPGDPGDWQVVTRLSASLGWHLPVDIDRWPLGQEPGAPGPMLLSLRPGGPNETAPLARPPREEETAEAPPRSGVEQAQGGGGVVCDDGIGAAP